MKLPSDRTDALKVTYFSLWCWYVVVVVLSVNNKKYAMDCCTKEWDEEGHKSDRTYRKGVFVVIELNSIKNIENIMTR